MIDLTFADVALVGLASASVVNLANVDKITQPARHWIVRRMRYSRSVIENGEPTGAYTHPSRNRVYNWLEYLIGCALCFPMWVSIGFVLLWQYQPVRIVGYILAARMLAWTLLRWLNEQNLRDWPEGFEWPPDDPA